MGNTSLQPEDPLDDWESEPVTSNESSSTIGAEAATFDVNVPLDPTAVFSSVGMAHIKESVKDEAQFGFNYEERVPVKGWEKDPYVYRTLFTATLIGRKPDSDSRKQMFLYEISGEFQCPEFDLEEYMHLRGKHLLFQVTPEELHKKTPSLKLQRFRWSFTPKDEAIDKASSNEFRDAAKRAFMYWVKNFHELNANLETAIKKFYEGINDEMKAGLASVSETVDMDGTVSYKPLKDAIGLQKEFGVYSKEYTSDLFDYLFGEKWHFYNGDDVRIEKGSILIPNYWVKTSESPSLTKKYIGYGMRTSVIEFSLEPYPWALFRVNRIWNELNRVISSNVAFGTSRRAGQGVVGREVYILGFKDKRVMFKKLSDKYFPINERLEEKLEVITSLAVGELEAEFKNER